ncbi:hypothetical protein XCR1_1300033 [Xenorhabdus cabanillasii JM26]|uniref:Uncharacterized protein n=1 Tax=Xenorhabdus cabanillasii JM26 TaxID=1427517 RepID=W1INC7_9GAMM|nr:hypothetical protein XCR1_1300033 [Xenorhabdus cabanillasii JM26]
MPTIATDRLSQKLHLLCESKKSYYLIVMRGYYENNSLGTSICMGAMGRIRKSCRILRIYRFIR